MSRPEAGVTQNTTNNEGDNLHFSLDIDLLRKPPYVIEKLREIEQSIMDSPGCAPEFTTDLFADSKLGRRAQLYILSGSPCEVLIEKGKRCGKRSIMTVDYDHPLDREEDQRPVCSFGHAQEFEDAIVSVALEMGKVPSIFGVNGFGRGTSKDS